MEEFRINPNIRSMKPLRRRSKSEGGRLRATHYFTTAQVPTREKTREVAEISRHGKLQGKAIACKTTRLWTRQDNWRNQEEAMSLALELLRMHAKQMKGKLDEVNKEINPIGMNTEKDGQERRCAGPCRGRSPARRGKKQDG